MVSARREPDRWAVVDNNPYDNGTCTPPTWTGAPGCQSLQQAARSSATNEFENTAKVCIDFPMPTPANPGATQLFANVTKVWTEGDQRNGIDMVGLSLTFKK